MNCKNMKIKTKKGKKYLFCRTKNCEISFYDCNGCEYKEYKMHNNCKNNVDKKKKCTVFTNDLTKCIMCGKLKDNLHEIFMGKNRQNSMKYGYVIPVCIKHHQICHRNAQIQEFWHKKGQLYFESEIGSRKEFISIFGRNYL